MKVMPTLEGGLRIDLEDRDDWGFLYAIHHDVAACDSHLADRLGSAVEHNEVAEDWREFVVPDLKHSFSSQLNVVAEAVNRALEEAAGGPGTLWIRRDDAYDWYGALNQARLAIEECHRFGPCESVDPLSLETEARQAFLRSQFYCALQSLLLENGMG